MLDVNKIDISDELKLVISPLAKNYHHKLLIVMNKCHTLGSVKDAIDVFSSAAWQLNMSIGIPEMPKMYYTSFASVIPDCIMLELIKSEMEEFKMRFENYGKVSTLEILKKVLDRIRNLRSYIYLNDYSTCHI